MTAITAALFLMMSKVYRQIFKGYFLSSFGQKSLIVEVPLDIGLHSFLTIDDLGVTRYIRNPGLRGMVRTSEDNRIFVVPDHKSGGTLTDFDVWIFYQFQDNLCGVPDAPMDNVKTEGVRLKGDVLLIKVSRDGRRVLDVVEQDGEMLQLILVR